MPFYKRVGRGAFACSICECKGCEKIMDEEKLPYVTKLKSSDPRVIEFIENVLGLNPSELVKLVITIESGKQLIVQETKHVRNNK